MDTNILRANDIRGAYPTQINKDVVNRIGNAFAVYLTNRNIKTCIVGHDNRLSSEELSKSLITSLINSGLEVVDIGLVTTPMFNYASISYNIPFGIMVTASHNKAGDNGLKIFGDEYHHLKQDELKKLYSLIENEAKISGTGSIRKMNIKENYINTLIKKFKPINKKVVVDCGNGTASTVIKEIFSQVFLNVTFINCESDGSFPVHNPDPNVEENLIWLKDIVKLKNADIGIAVDGDCDRVGIVDEKGNMIPTDYLIGILAREIIPQNENKNVVIDVKCSVALDEEIRKIGGNPIMVKNGSAYIEGIMSEVPALIGGEYSGHIFIRDDYYGYDDGIYVALRIAQILDKSAKKCSQLIEGMNVYENTPEIRIEVADNIKFDVIDQIKEYCIKKDYNCNFEDGVRVNYEDGFSLVRCSNTGPYITLRFEASTKEILELRKNEFLNLMNELIK